VTTELPDNAFLRTYPRC